MTHEQRIEAIAEYNKMLGTHITNRAQLVMLQTSASDFGIWLTHHHPGWLGLEPELKREGE